MAAKDRLLDKEERQAYEQLVQSCLSLDAKQDEKNLSILKANVIKSSQNLRKQSALFKDDIAQVPLSTFILLWGELMCNDNMIGNRHLKIMRDLVETELLPLTDNKKTITLQNFSLYDPSFVIERVRCHKDWSIHKREEYVLLYKAFSEWISKETFGYIPEAKDLDHIATQKRLLPFETYIEILSHMDLREQILAKLFYLGGNRALEEVLSLKIEDIDFSQSLIHFSEDISYPQHVFEDIKKHTANRKKGYVFVGREEERISTTTPFRALKKIASELDLDPEFTFKEFTRNI